MPLADKINNIAFYLMCHYNTVTISLPNNFGYEIQLELPYFKNKYILPPFNKERLQSEEFTYLNQ